MNEEYNSIETVKKMLECNQKGEVKHTISNYKRIFMHDPMLKAAFQLNLFTDKIDINFRTAIGLTDMVDMQKAFNKVGSDDDDRYYDEDDDDDDGDDAPSFGFKNLRFQLGVTFWFM